MEPAIMAPKLISKGKDKDIGEGKQRNRRHIGRWPTNFLDVAFEEKSKGNRPGKAFNAVEYQYY